MCKDPGQLIKKGEELGLESNTYYAVVLLQLSSSMDSQVMDRQVHLIIGEIKNIFKNMHR